MGPMNKHGDTFVNNRNLPSVHSESGLRSRSRASTYTEPQRKRRTKNTILNSPYIYTMKLSICVMINSRAALIYCCLTFCDEYQHLVL